MNRINFLGFFFVSFKKQILLINALLLWIKLPSFVIQLISIQFYQYSADL